jgi:hypothetical protein
MRRWIVLGLAVTAGSCNWITTARQALTYPTVGPGEAANLVVQDSLVYVTLGGAGLAVLEARSRAEVARIAPEPGSESSDALALDGDLLFVLDARPPGHLSVYSLGNPRAPRLLSPPREVPVGPFSTVSARGGLSVVSGGTSQLIAWRYDAGGLVGAEPTARVDLGRGQPGATVSSDGRTVYVATHYYGPRFGLEVIRIGPAGTVEHLGSLPLPGAGFTEGGAQPANFPIVPVELSVDSVLVAYGEGLGVVRAPGSGQAVTLETLPLGGPAVSASVEGRRALVGLAGSTPALVLVDFSGARPRVVRRIGLPPGTQTLGTALTRTQALVAVRAHGVLGFD